ncbi:hypothetical protein [Tunturiibacter psychrotolerans]|uniref:hypothetical protein n=1 Tax=Tunturiibacter psychrotolerans TaxID=3069686 RepID=UPI003D20DA20
MKILCHRHRDPHVERVAGLPVAMQDQVAGDGAFRNADGRTGWAAEEQRSGDVADGCSGNEGAARFEVRAVDVELPAGHGRERRDAVEMRRWCVGFVGREKRAECGHGPEASVDGCGGERNCRLRGRR